MQKRSIGQSALNVHPIGLGCMGFSEFYGKPTEEAEAIATIHKAIELGVDHFDTAEMYGMGANEKLLGKALKGTRDKVVIASKFGIGRDRKTGAVTGLDGSKASMRASCEGSLRALGVDSIDLYYQHRMDPNTPIEETMEGLLELVSEGKIRAIGLSECSAQTLRRACAVHPVAAVQSEYSLFSRDIEDEIIPACQELGVSLVAYSPLGRGMLTGQYSREDKGLSASDYRHTQPRFAGDNYADNLALVDVVKAIAVRHDAHPAQIALAWVLAQGEHVLSIPGTTKASNLTSNMKARSVVLDQDDLAQLSILSAKVKGDRYGDMSVVNR
ncbi:MAG: aldo/keto reductase [Robiginitomaculum sp.]|nr:MAG: aldo/keto reductase [Robiginitomaculum sp.]